MMRILFTKDGHADDATPSGAVAALAVPKRVFGFSADVESSQSAGAKTAALAFDIAFLDSAGAAVAGITCSAELFLLNDSETGSERWCSEGPAQASLAAGAAAIFPFAAVAESKRAFLKITNVAGASVASVNSIVVRGEPRGAMLNGNSIWNIDPTSLATEASLVAATPITLALITQTFATGHAEDIGGAKTKLGSVFAANRNAAVRYLLLSKTADARTDAAALSIPCPTGITPLGTNFFGALGWTFGAHLSYAWSTGPAGSYGAATAGEHDTVLMGA